MSVISVEKPSLSAHYLIYI
ncbi:hypothetical protein LEMLEM_LOCUS19113 [Lemmus lemmus]